MSITIHIFYKGTNGNAKKFVAEMAPVAKRIRQEAGNLRYDYFYPADDPETVLLIDSWKDQSALDVHHASPMMKEIAALRDKYDLHMTVERFISDETAGEKDSSFIRH